MFIYKNFREIDRYSERFQSEGLSKYYDEPTYQTFRLVFEPGDEWNGAVYTNYDNMPHPLLSLNEYKTNLSEITTYSTYSYLKNCNEVLRAEMLLELIKLLNSLQYNFQWYFQSISGVNELVKVDPTKGIRIPEGTSLTISCLEGLDLRMSYILNLYKKIAWDDTYQRWILPDMMRYFKLKIYITEFRDFHTTGMGTNSLILNRNEDKQTWFGKASKQVINSYVPPATRALINGKDADVQFSDVILSMLDNIVPTWVIECNQCQFDLGSMDFKQLGTLSASNQNETTIEFKIKVGNITEKQYYPSFKLFKLEDNIINEKWRSVSEDEIIELFSKSSNLSDLHAIASNNENLTDRERSHTSGTAYNIPGSISDSGKEDPLIPKVFGEKASPWLKNMESTVRASAQEKAEQFIDKAKMTPIGGITSINELDALLGSKNLLTVFNYLKDAIARYQAGEIKPSEKLDSLISTSLAGTIYEMSAKKISSTATTDKENKLGGKLASQKDRSIATDLDGGPNINKSPVIITMPPSHLL